MISGELPRYLVGIDLGTTHTVVAYADSATENLPPPIQLFKIEQLIAPGEVGARVVLPSLRYHPSAEELAQDDMRLPWPEPSINTDLPPGIVGELAQTLGSQVPGRLVASAKSWLSHPAVDRSAAILPWGGGHDMHRISPVEASASYLAHVRAAWNCQFPEHPLENQDIVLTVPASFDEIARTLTVEAARLAGLIEVRLLEEPQAACYDWLNQHRETLESDLAITRLLLVCDVGGGTTDLTLIKVEPGRPEPQLTRIGVGDHLMLGGDNMDLALTHIAEGRIAASGPRLSAANLSQLVQQCRLAKERLLAPHAPQNASVTVLGAGTKLVGAARSTEFSRDEVRAMVLDGFLPITDMDEQPQRLRSGIVEFGLPYVADPAISRHVAAFLSCHAQACRDALGELAPEKNKPAMPDTVLLNGGVFRSELLVKRLLQVLDHWRGSPLRQLSNEAPDLAVARGAVAYALSQRGVGLRIGGGSPRSYFLLVENDCGKKRRGVCVLPRGTQDGQELQLEDRTFSLRLRQPVRFHMVSSTSDTQFHLGELVDTDAMDFKPLPPIATVLEATAENQGVMAGDVAVQLLVALTEVGTLEVNCVTKDPPTQRWQLAFQLRDTGGAPIVTTNAEELHPRFSDAVQRVWRIYGQRVKGVGPREVKTLRRDLEKILGDRDNWGTSLLREVYGVLWDGARRRRRSTDHERLWFNLAGYCLRPGYGYPLDDWRVHQLWTLFDQGVQYAHEARVWAEWWTLWRRVAGGLDERSQQRLLENIQPYLRPPASRKDKRQSGPLKQSYDDMVRLAASLERITAERKVEVGEWLLERLRRKGESPQTWWAIARIGARVPLYGSAHNVVPREVASRWLEKCFTLDWHAIQQASFAATLISRMSGDRARDLSPEHRSQVIDLLRAAKSPTSWIEMVDTVVTLNAADEQRIFGDSLPPGLRLIS